MWKWYQDVPFCLMIGFFVLMGLVAIYRTFLSNRKEFQQDKKQLAVAWPKPLPDWVPGQYFNFVKITLQDGSSHVVVFGEVGIDPRYGEDGWDNVRRRYGVKCYFGYWTRGVYGFIAGSEIKLVEVAPESEWFDVIDSHYHPRRKKELEWKSKYEA
ncbi:MAG: hypothetical protein KGJ13_03830 [Patescibacteria group bacterium]|nr:hypothetical protein [Patescibacteria group bacterium]